MAWIDRFVHLMIDNTCRCWKSILISGLCSATTYILQFSLYAYIVRLCEYFLESQIYRLTGKPFSSTVNYSLIVNEM